jgi:hypothetical protein
MHICVHAYEFSRDLHTLVGGLEQSNLGFLLSVERAVLDP